MARKEENMYHYHVRFTGISVRAGNSQEDDRSVVTKAGFYEIVSRLAYDKFEQRQKDNHHQMVVNWLTAQASHVQLYEVVPSEEVTRRLAYQFGQKLDAKKCLQDWLEAELEVWRLYRYTE
jgi:hypothetical protein